MSELQKSLEPDGYTEDVWSSKGYDCNAPMLPAKKKNKTRVMNQSNKGKQDGKHLSKNQIRKLKQLQVEKEKKALESKSYKILEKYKIPDDAYLLLQSSANIAQVETMRQKLRRAVQLSRAGLEVPLDVPLFKKRNTMSVFMGEATVESDSSKIHSKQECRDGDDLSCLKSERNDLKSSIPMDYCMERTCVSNLSNTNAGSDTALPSPEFADKETDTSWMRENLKDSQNLERDSSKLDSHRSSLPSDCLVQKPLNDMTPVHVMRPVEVEEKRGDLPIVMMEQEIMEAINENSSVIICGETGCGKTTQVPQFLYEAGFGSRRGIIGVTQPRRVAVLATAKRVAFEMGLQLGKEVGFQVRHDKRIGDSCSIKFMTDGILLREVQSDFLLRRYSVIILDEAHERSLSTDILVGMLSRIIEVRQKLHEEQQEKALAGVKLAAKNVITPLKLVLMSATLRVEDFISGSRLFQQPPPVVEVPTRQFPVTIHFSKKTETVDYVGQAYKKVMSIHKRLPPGGVLVFLTGQREIEFLCRKLRKASAEPSKRSSKANTESGKASGMDSLEQDPLTKNIYEAFEVDEEQDYEEIRSESSESEIESDKSEDEDSYDHGKMEETSTKSDALRVPGSIAALKSAFEALASNRKDGNQGESPNLPITADCSKSSLDSHKSHELNSNSPGPLYVLPLYAMLPAGAQLRVFKDVPEGERLVVVATNVAETSLTIPGIKYVVDTGREKVKNYNCGNGMASYEVQWISKASASQRAGRAGRTGPGHCYRLYSSAVFSNTFSDFSIPEIQKIPVDGVFLLMKYMGIDKVANFPFPTPPETSSLEEAEHCLKVLEALDSQGRLTPIGKAMAQYPMSPRHSRMLLTVIQIMRKWQDYARSNIVLGYTVAAAAALSSSTPFITQFDADDKKRVDLDQDDKAKIMGDHEILDRHAKSKQKQQKAMAKAARAKFCNPISDALTVAYVLQLFELVENRSEFCQTNCLHLKTMEEMSKLRKQLLHLVFNQSSNGRSEQEFSWTHGNLEDVERAWRVFSNKNPLLLNEEELLSQAICAGWADRVAKRIRTVSEPSDGKKKSSGIRFQACMVTETVLIHRLSSVAHSPSEFVVYNELVQMKRPYMHGVTSVKSDWLMKYARSLCTFSAPLQDPKPYYEPLTDQVMCWVSASFGPHLWDLPLHSMPIQNDNLRASVFASELLGGKVLPCLKSVQKFLAANPCSIMKAEGRSQRRVGELLNKLKTRSRVVDSRAKLREIWDENPQEFHDEILSWFQEKFHGQFEELWQEMHDQVSLEDGQLFPISIKRKKRISIDPDMGRKLQKSRHS